jgi:hypothetical protein
MVITLRIATKASGGRIIIPSITRTGITRPSNGSLCPGGTGNIYRRFSENIKGGVEKFVTDYLEIRMNAAAGNFFPAEAALRPEPGGRRIELFKNFSF